MLSPLPSGNVLVSLHFWRMFSQDRLLTQNLFLSIWKMLCRFLWPPWSWQKIYSHTHSFLQWVRCHFSFTGFKITPWSLYSISLTMMHIAKHVLFYWFGFTQLLESVDLFLLQNFKHFYPLFLQIFLLPHAPPSPGIPKTWMAHIFCDCPHVLEPLFNLFSIFNLSSVWLRLGETRLTTAFVLGRAVQKSQVSTSDIWGETRQI